MRPIAQTFYLGLGIALAATSAPVRSNADSPQTAPAVAACLGGISAVHADAPNTVVVRVVNPDGPLTGTITAYGADRKWTGTLGRSIEIDKPGLRVLSVAVRAEAPILGIEYAPAWGQCAFRAPVIPRVSESSDPNPPLLVLSQSLPAEPLTCAHPYLLPSVTHAFEPMTPVRASMEGAHGTVSVRVALDERGIVQSADIVSSPSVVLNAPSLDAARRSTYAPAIFRCTPVPGAYVFAVDYS